MLSGTITSGGNQIYSMLYLTNGYGAVKEADYPYSTTEEAAQRPTADKVE